MEWVRADGGSEYTFLHWKPNTENFYEALVDYYAGCWGFTIWKLDKSGIRVKWIMLTRCSWWLTADDAIAEVKTFNPEAPHES